MTYALFDQDGICVMTADTPGFIPADGHLIEVPAGTTPNDVWFDGATVFPTVPSTLELPQVLDSDSGEHTFDLPANTVAIVCGERRSGQLVIDTSVVQNVCVDIRGAESGNFVVKVADYAGRRKLAYPPMADQLDMIFHEGVEAWQQSIQEIKEQHPKPA